MKHQLIITILGADRVGILSQIAAVVSETGCNILDSRQAIYGQDFSLTMILEGTQGAIIKAELKIPQICQQLDLLSMMKRTSEHSKQNLEHIVDVEFSGVDTPGVIQKVTALLAKHEVAVSAFRQKTSVDKQNQCDTMKCKLVASVPAQTSMDALREEFTALLGELGLTGNIVENH
ncbi:glycine cleavage system transcriptional repressor [Aestuariibacter halophilus]|uniref:Glycine cleavage system transcriptional repressor n=1 Tax=Fluctibacter halophilus TaxID=226011 RepID=A0ABS8G642_9ALTE|nr:ACT domain-containing protein [Aestuariibacter halophilus]MCC2615576.1 glycine cleavage system transcriptional repressor [Aestuariibacter halophilus]